MPATPRRIIEVDLPIRKISAHARREKSIRHGHISTLHIWWARRPLAACRAVLCAALWPDPVDDACPPAFRQAISLTLAWFAEQTRSDQQVAKLVAGHWSRWVRMTADSMNADDPACWGEMREALLDFIADFANWDASTVPAFLETARLLTVSAHNALTDPEFQLPVGDEKESVAERFERLKFFMLNLNRPLVVDPFAGGGSIPLEALRVGADAFASDLNPVAVLLNKVILEYIPKYGNAKIEITGTDGKPLVLNGLAEAVRYWGNWIKTQAEKELAAFYPKDPDGATPIAYLWARTVTCEGPGCGAEVPLMRSLWLVKKGERSVALQLVPDKANKRVDFEIIEKRAGKWVVRDNPQAEIKNPQLENGTVRRGSATCPVCGYTTPVERVRVQLKTRHGGAQDSRLFCIVTTKADTQGRFYRLPNARDLLAFHNSAVELQHRKEKHTGTLSLVPDEEIPLTEIRRISVPIYGIENWGDFFTARQALTLVTLGRLANEIPNQFPYVATCLALAIDRQANSLVSMARWNLVGEKVEGIFARQAIGMIWDFAEVNPFSGSTGDFDGALEWVEQVLEKESPLLDIMGHVEMSSATSHPLPDDTAKMFFTDPPYYDAVPYSHLSDFFYVWLKRILCNHHPDLFSTNEVNKINEIVVDRPHALSNSSHDIEYYERELTKAFAESRRVLAPDGIGTIVFASKTTASWEAILQAVVSAGWVITGSWPIDTEMESRVAAQGQARLASSIHLVCRPRESDDGSIPDTVGNWREVLAELPIRIKTWLPRLAAEGVVGADALFACLGPALEIFSRYGRVETASGEQISLKQYLEVVWAAVAREALSMIFEGADATGFEEDARLTAIWLWTLTAKDDSGDGASSSTAETDVEDSDGDARSASLGGYSLEYDAARKISQGLGAHLERLGHLVHVKGDQARLLSVRERSGYLFGKDDPLDGHKSKVNVAQMDLFTELSPAENESTAGWDGETAPPPGQTVLDWVHQSMLLFTTGRSEALKRFLADTSVGRDPRFWRLAQALSALYPSGSDEKRWVDGVLARKKGLGF